MEATDLKKELSKSYDLFLEVIENNSIGMIFTDVETKRLQYVNRSFLSNFGYTTDEVIGKTSLELDLIDPESREELLYLLEKDGSVKACELLVRKKSGERFWTTISVQITKIGGKQFALNSFIDITEQKKTELKMLQLASIVEFSHDSIISKSLDGIIMSWNKGAEKMFEYSAKQAVGKHISLIIPPDLLYEEHDFLERIFKNEITENYETVRLKQNGERINVSLTVSPVRDKKGNIIGISKIARDISDEKKASYTRNLIEVSLDPLVTIGIDGKIADLNDAMVVITGVSREQLIGTDFFDHFTDHQKAREVYQEVFAKGYVSNASLTIRHKLGKRTDVLFNGSVFNDDKGNVQGVVIIARDVSDQKWAKEIQIANKELALQNKEKEKRAAELVIANKELAYQNNEKEKRAAELKIANRELAYQNDVKGKRADELVIANKELAFQNDEKGKRADELAIANRELAYQNNEKEKRADELIIANIELAFQNDEKEKLADELIIANKELAFQNDEKEKRAAELWIANKELVFQTGEKEKRAAELVIADLELDFQNKEKEKREIASRELEAFNYSVQLASQYSRSLIEASLDPLFTISPDGKITDLNNASVKITGVERNQLIGTDFFDYFTDPEKAREGYQQVFANGFVSNYPLTMRDHKLTDVLFNGSVYKDGQGNVLGVVVVARDVTDQNRIRKELNEAIAIEELATVIAEEAKLKAENATKLAEDSVKSKQQFLSNMSHEIRTPMNAIIGFTKVVLKTELTAKQKEYLSAIKLSGDALIVLINDILDLAKVDAGKMTFEKIPFKLELSISAMAHLFETKIQEKNLMLVKEYDSRIPDVLVGDPVRLHQIILNLLSNAVKFTTNGSITLRICLLSEDASKVSIQFFVTDTGIGIAENKLDQIFENFQQASSDTSRLYGGTGLGLAIFKNLVEQQGGTVSVSSTVNEGSSFGFILSFEKTNAVADVDMEITELDTERKHIKILVVEDMELNQLLMKTVLDDFGFERDIAANGRIAIEKLQSKSYDIILMDLQMPEMNGFEATEFIRNKMNSKIPIIALTADVTTVDLAKCKAVGMNDYIAKPIDERLLYNKIISLVMKPAVTKPPADAPAQEGKLKCINLNYLNKRTKSNPVLMMEMISVYLEQTPPLISALRQSLDLKDWKTLAATAHKIIPTFSIMGISPDFEIIAKKVQEYASTQELAEGIPDMVTKLERICAQACAELEEELNLIKNTNL